jgi:predicted DNA-binding protein
VIEDTENGHRRYASTVDGTIHGMATNLRLRPEAEEAVRAEAARSGRSQQEVIRDAVDRYLALKPDTTQANDLDVLIAAGTVRPPRTPYRKARRRITLPAGMTSADLLDRADRF